MPPEHEKMNAIADRTRLVLVTTPLPDGADGISRLRAALSGGDVASVIIPAAGREGAAFQDFVEPLVELAQAAGAAALVCDDTRCAGRTKADSIHVTGGIEELGDAVARFSPKLIVGASGFETRHDALEAGERLPDYLFFGSFDHAAAETDADAAEMAAWWADIVELPCILMAGSDLASIEAAIETRAEFVALSHAVFDAADPAAAVAAVNERLEAAPSVAA